MDVRQHRRNAADQSKGGNHRKLHLRGELTFFRAVGLFTFSTSLSLPLFTLGAVESRLLWGPRCNWFFCPDPILPDSLV